MLAGALPPPATLAASGVRVTDAAEGGTLGDVADKLARAGEGSADQAPLVQLGPGLPALPKKLVGKIEAEEYVDFNELPPAKGKGRPLSQPSTSLQCRLRESPL